MAQYVTVVIICTKAHKIMETFECKDIYLLLFPDEFSLLFDSQQRKKPQVQMQIVTKYHLKMIILRLVSSQNTLLGSNAFKTKRYSRNQPYLRQCNVTKSSKYEIHLFSSNPKIGTCLDQNYAPFYMMSCRNDVMSDVINCMPYLVPFSQKG